MKVNVNGEEIRIFERARVEDAVRKYSLADYKKVIDGKKIVQDQYGNQAMLTGELAGNEELTIKTKK
ncbi:hypothetical protein [Natroniella sp. ANB-PHB2]|uniref:hypothetical protein n=1 Tax=Natroniella sp. ANB-PHB2 TaxID=3384444 RepID=UPI0038D47468